MEETLKDMVLVLGRIITILPLLLFMTIFMGKRAIGELPIFDFLIILTLGAVVGADIADPEIKHLPTAFTILIIALIQRIVANWKLSNRKIGRLITFEPTLVVQDGKLLKQNIKSIRYSIDNILQMLREKDVFAVEDVEMAIVEANGALSVLKKPEKQTVTNESMQMNTESSISFPVIMEGEVYTDVLRYFQVDEVWLFQELIKQQIRDKNEIFFATLNARLELSVTLKDEQNSVNAPPFYH
ncbi:DUF421 domain-containing protein [Bacillus weihaiensis]|uniref:YetF C-terminal domain-containing protein n=1 Tax=Bacillus weihaiensis TaxID=1547283 RepID=A0A1L3MX27_9BACI|nr:DUF421 domain-containing protein [Bacillus weihaiensis]APH06868.1 hypothetical protein A9C19_20545 [Bacillus weihaiensis]